MLRISLALFLLGGCGSLFQLDKVELPAGSDGGIGGDSADAPDGRQRVWATPRPMGELNTGFVETAPSMTKDELHVMFSSNREDNTYSLFAASRSSTSTEFGPPVKQFVTCASDCFGFLTEDGVGAYLTGFTQDCQYATRSSADDSFGLALPYSQLSTVENDRHVEVSADNLHAVVTHNDGMLADLVLYSRATPADSWGAYTALTGLNVGGVHDGSGSLTSDGLVIYFHSERSGERLIYTAKRVTAAAMFEDPTVVPDLEDGNSAGGSDPWISPDGNTLMFVRNNDLYITTRP